jgi:uncharacterized protein (DUF2147 family)
MRRILSLSLLLSASAVAFAATHTGVTGDWKTTTNSIVRVAPCRSASSTADQTVCLTIVQVPPSAPETTDQENPDTSLRTRPLCGLAVGTGFHQGDPSHLTGGHLYDPKSGRTYKGRITAEGDTLQLHGYIGISVFGRTETWHRVPTVPTCQK